MAASDETYVTRGACEAHTRTLMESQAAMLGKLESIEKRLFKDNGRVSMQTRIDRHEQALRLLLWVVGVIAATLLSSFAGGVALLAREAFVKVAAG